MRLIFHCTDGDGNAVDVESSDLEPKNLSAALDNAKKIIAELGLTQSKANGNGNGKAKEKVIIDGVHCPKCGKAVWDNRNVKLTDAAKAKWPDFSCKDKDGCKWAVWPGQYTMLNGNGNGA